MNAQHVRLTMVSAPPSASWQVLHYSAACRSLTFTMLNSQCFSPSSTHTHTHKYQNHLPPIYHLPLYLTHSFIRRHAHTHIRSLVFLGFLPLPHLLLFFPSLTTQTDLRCSTAYQG
uniref:Uncharacterized protein n=1 Tax=Trypanosoma vivax (strain Y486) TaxID=1055687 RepID=G0U1H4_TRYVY|nr:hypothetical protein, unlikely [Trypanosoma vivax Y486]